MPDTLHTDSNRRNFIKISAIGLAIAPLTNLLTSTAVQAAAVKPDVPDEASALSEDDQQAKVLHYTENAATAKAGKRKGDQFCHNCQVYSGQPDAEWGPCAVFSYRTNPNTGKPYLVNAGGWCDAWGPRASAR